MVEIDSVATIIDTSETVRMIASTPDPKRHRRFSPRTLILAASHIAARTCNQSTGNGFICIA
jgi:hypothetical protein